MSNNSTTTTTTTTTTAVAALASDVLALGSRDLPPGDPDRAQPLYILFIPGVILLVTLGVLALTVAYCWLRRCLVRRGHGNRLHRAEDCCFPPRYRMPWS